MIFYKDHIRNFPEIVEAIPKLEAIEKKYHYQELEFLFDTYFDTFPDTYEQREIVKIGYMLSPFGYSNGCQWNTFGKYEIDWGHIIKKAEEFVNNHCINRYGMDYNGVYGAIKEQKLQIEQQNGGYLLDLDSLFTSKNHIPIQIDEITLDFHPTNNYIELKVEA